MDFNVSSWPWFDQKPIVRVKTSFKKLSVGGGWWWCTRIITSALGPGLARSQLLRSKPAFKSYGVGGGWWVVVVVHSDYSVSSWPWFGQKPIVRVKTSFKKLSVGGGGGGGGGALGK